VHTVGGVVLVENHLAPLVASRLQLAGQRLELLFFQTSEYRHASQKFYVDYWLSPGDCDSFGHYITGCSGRGVTEFGSPKWSML
jgi:hypothetical protein